MVAMSGGVDSAVAALLLKNQGYEVNGITFKVCSEDSSVADYAASVARHLGIKHEILDLSQLFNDLVIEPFCQCYAIGETPNPCIACNRYIKFGALLEYAVNSGADYLATGHYARIEFSEGTYYLKKGIDSNKDQSYFLYTLDQKQLKKVLFPLGTYYKKDIRVLARDIGLKDKIQPNESQDICFLATDNYASLVKKRAGSEPGVIVDTSGNVIGKHKGIIYYTIGQRQGLGITSSERLYILELDPKKNRIIAGKKEDLFCWNLVAGDLTWINGIPQNLQGLTARVRYRGLESPVDLDIKADQVEVNFLEPQWAVTPGQSIVFYDNDEVLGGGIIKYPVKAIT
jgi:tRNA-specific 2-thiouridylase